MSVVVIVAFPVPCRVGIVASFTFDFRICRGGEKQKNDFSLMCEYRGIYGCSVQCNAIRQERIMTPHNHYGMKSCVKITQCYQQPQQ